MVGDVQEIALAELHDSRRHIKERMYMGCLLKSLSDSESWCDFGDICAQCV